MWQNVLTAFALFFVIEGILPFSNPDKWRALVLMLVHQTDRFLRLMGFVSMLIGVIFVYFARFII